jgi:hypothetical protein
MYTVGASEEAAGITLHERQVANAFIATLTSDNGIESLGYLSLEQRLELLPHPLRLLVELSLYHTKDAPENHWPHEVLCFIGRQDIVANKALAARGVAPKPFDETKTVSPTIGAATETERGGILMGSDDSDGLLSLCASMEDRFDDDRVVEVSLGYDRYFCLSNHVFIFF